MSILIACEESQAVAIAFRKLGHEAYSCDVEPCSGGRPEWHIREDALSIINDDWDMIIAHPPCTYLANSGVCWLTGKNAQQGRWAQLDAGASFFKMFLDHPCEKIAIENPIMHKYAIARIGGTKHTQVIHPWMFGHAESKATCFWLKGLQPLVATDIVKSKLDALPKRERQRLHYLPPGPNRAKLRSKTFPGIAKAMAEQWGAELK